MKVGLVAGSPSVSGISRYASGLYEGFGRRGVPTSVRISLATRVPGNRLSRQLLNLDVESFLQTYPVQPLRGNADVFHLTHQTLASTLWLPPRQPVVVTVHDIFPFMFRADPRLGIYSHALHRAFDRAAMRLLGRAAAILTDCAAVRDDLQQWLGIAPARIVVVPLGIDHKRFHRVEIPPDFWPRYRLDPDGQYALHVSSEEPRKNFESLLHAWRIVVRDVPSAVLLKVGQSYFPLERKRNLDLVGRLGLQDSVRFIESVPEVDLVYFYNAAQVFAFPSVAEGFGFPVLEAMACGTPVVCSEIAALHELVGSAALLRPATDPAALADALVQVLANPLVSIRLVALGQARAAEFTWEKMADATYGIYTEVLGRS